MIASIIKRTTITQVNKGDLGTKQDFDKRMGFYDAVAASYYGLFKLFSYPSCLLPFLSIYLFLSTVDRCCALMLACWCSTRLYGCSFSREKFKRPLKTEINDTSCDKSFLKSYFKQESVVGRLYSFIEMAPEKNLTGIHILF